MNILSVAINKRLNEALRGQAFFILQQINVNMRLYCTLLFYHFLRKPKILYVTDKTVPCNFILHIYV